MPGRLVATGRNHDIENNSPATSQKGQTVEVRINVGKRQQQDDTKPKKLDLKTNADDEDTHEEIDGAVRSVKMPEEKMERLSAEEAQEAGFSAEDEGSANGDTESSDQSSDTANEWEGESDAAEEAGEKVTDANTCIFCGEDEEHDPGEDFEEYLACAVCGDNAHRHCARTARSFPPDQVLNANLWRCPTCIENELQATRDPSEVPSRRRSSVPKIARDLLPAQRGAKPDSYSIFDQLIVDDDPENGSRLLRKRKASDEAEEARKTESKRRRHKSESSAVPDSPRELRRRSTSVIADPNGKHESTLQADQIALTGNESPGSRPARLRPRREQEKPLVHIISKDDSSLLLAFSLNPTKLAKIVSVRARKRDRKRDRSRKIMPPREEVSHYPAIQPPTFAVPFSSFHDRENDDLKSKPYGGVLTEAEADTSRTFPQAIDRKRFEEARQKAEDDWKQKMASATAATENARTSQKVSGPPSKIKCINFGGYEIDTWHAAPYPEEYSRNKILYICEFCLKYMSSDFVAWRHKLKCPAKHPPGDEIYRDGNFSFFEVDGRKNPVYCQNLCLLAKLFLGSKTLYYDVEPFLFYVMTEYDEYGYHFVGYFSKEKRPSSQNNVSCILVLPIHQRRGFGHLLIDFSYLLTRVEKKTGSPEKPLSDMGLVSYRSYWRLILCYQLINQTTPISLSTISERTGMTTDDIISALEGLRALVRDPVTKTYALRLDYAYFKEYIENYERKQYTKLSPDALMWTPYVVGRNSQAQYEDAPPLQTIAPRDDEEEEAVKAQPEEGVQLLALSGEPDAQPQVNGEATEQAVPTAGSALIPDIIPDVIDESGISHATTPGPLPITSLPNTEARPSPSQRRSQSQALGPTTPAPNGLPTSSFPIPPTRFEVFPNIPGTATRRRNRPSRGGNRRTATPIRRGGKVFGSPAQHSANVAGSIRRTRSTLGESKDVVTADQDEEKEEVDDEVGGEEVGPKGDEADGDADGEEEYVPAAEEEAEDDVVMEEA